MHGAFRNQTGQEKREPKYFDFKIDRSVFERGQQEKSKLKSVFRNHYITTTISSSKLEFKIADRENKFM